MTCVAEVISKNNQLNYLQFGPPFWIPCRRLGNARGELEYGMKKGNFHYIVVNDMVDRAYGDLKRAILRTYGSDGSAAPPLGRSD
jgi:hypothetical protein